MWDKKRRNETRKAIDLVGEEESLVNGIGVKELLDTCDELEKKLEEERGYYRDYRALRSSAGILKNLLKEAEAKKSALVEAAQDHATNYSCLPMGEAEMMSRRARQVEELEAKNAALVEVIQKIYDGADAPFPDASQKDMMGRLARIVALCSRHLSIDRRGDAE